MAGISTAISVVDKLTSPVEDMTSAMDRLIAGMQETHDASERMVDPESINSGTQGMNFFKNGIDGATKAADGLHSILGKVASVAGIIGGIKWISGWVSDTFELANAQVNVQTQLKTVLANMGAEEDAYDRILAKASELQGKSIYGDEAYIAGAAELATYMSDTDALLSMMDTLSTYATGMTGGEALDITGMTNMATGLGKVTTGAYDAMTKKGFEFTKAQKAVMDGTATEAQLVEALGEDYATMSEEMQQAAILAEIVGESWDGLAEAMAATPEGKQQQMINSWGDVKEMVGNQLTPAMNRLFDTINAHMPQIQNAIVAVSGLINGVIYVISGVIDAIGGVYDAMVQSSDTTMMVIEVIAGTVTVLGAIIWNLALGTINLIIDLVVDFWNFCAIFANFIANFMVDPMGSIVRLFTDTFDWVLGLLETVANAIDWVFGSHLGDSLSGFRSDVQEWVDTNIGKAEIDYRINKDDMHILSDSRISYEDAALAGINWGEGFARELLTGYEPTDYTVDIKGIKGGVDDLNEAVSSGDIITILKDMAERDAINRFTTAEINVALGGVTNNVNNNTDLDGIVSYITDAVGEQLTNTAAAYNSVL